jgi:hypothetical protein
MDPYLEHPTLWPGVHLGLIPNARAALNDLLLRERGLCG